MRTGACPPGAIVSPGIKEPAGVAGGLGLVGQSEGGSQAAHSLCQSVFSYGVMSVMRPSGYNAAGSMGVMV